MGEGWGSQAEKRDSCWDNLPSPEERFDSPVTLGVLRGSILYENTPAERADGENGVNVGPA